MERWSGVCGDVVWRLLGGGLEDLDRWSGGCAEVVWQMWSGSLKDVERRSGGCGDVVFLEAEERWSRDCTGEVVWTAMVRRSRGCGQVVWKLRIGGIDDMERWSRGCRKVV